ncbi:MAG: helix-turn-helix domain-containing protein [Tannerella sp.]|jgi:transcriptional regulator with XRE-family HTH domain|nr:helix-turn-helix domain-containing protein [Tannerella sp.]
MKDRIIQIMEHEGLKPSEFAESIGIQRAAISHYMTGRNDPSLDVIKRIHETYPAIRLEWLLYGTGEMLSPDKDRQTPGQQLEIFTAKTQADRSPGTTEKLQPASPPLKSSRTVENRATVHPTRENRRETRVERPKKEELPPKQEELTPQKSPQKTVSKILIFYSDNTFEAFVPAN